MYLSDNELKAALDDGTLIVEPRPQIIDASSIDVHLGPIESVTIWDEAQWERDERAAGHDPAVHLGPYNYREFSTRYQCPPPDYERGSEALVMRKGKDEVWVRPGGFLLWMTEERIGTPEESPKFICFIDGKSTKARTGIVVHLTAPTIHAGWSGNVVLEIKNLGDLTCRRLGGVVTCATVICAMASPGLRMDTTAKSQTHGQTKATGESR